MYHLGLQASRGLLMTCKMLLHIEMIIDIDFKYELFLKYKNLRL